ncbi:MAG TPA: DUF6790 family protein [Candidatus Micrarchaeaceae archaeon]|nr:DUF6790 family protein [Candidatus Micrarchaeaceae archaeon]
MIFVVVAAIGFVLALLHIAIQKGLRTRRGVANTLLLYFFAFPVGLGGLLGFVGHTMRAGPVAASIGWPAGNPFQYEVAVANLAFGVLGILCLRFGDGFWTATAIGWSIFMLGAAAVHLHQIHIGQPYAPANAGAMLYFDIIAPVGVLVLLVVRAA